MEVNSRAIASKFDFSLSFGLSVTFWNFLTPSEPFAPANPHFGKDSASEKSYWNSESYNNFRQNIIFKHPRLILSTKLDAIALKSIRHSTDAIPNLKLDNC